MITRMKHIDILVYHKEKELLIQKLRALGPVHIVERTGDIVDNGESGLAAAIARTTRILADMKKNAGPDYGTSTDTASCSPAEVVDVYEKLLQSEARLQSDAAALHEDLVSLQKWGDFSPEKILALRARGVNLRLLTMPEKTYDHECKSNSDTIFEIFREKGVVAFAFVDKGGAVPDGSEETSLPENAPGTLRGLLDKAKHELAEIDKQKKAAAVHCAIVENYAEALRADAAALRAAASMELLGNGAVVKLTGWIPRSACNKVQQELDKITGWSFIREPLPGEDVPIQLINSPFTRLFEPILKVYSLPDYHEFDPTPFFAPFFMLFVGLCLGDAGYGLLLVAAGIVAIFKAPVKLQPVAKLVTVLGLSTTVCGVLLNGAFGHTLFGGAGVAEGTAFFPKGAEQFSPLGAVDFGKGQVFPMMSFALFIGVVQIFTGMLLRALNQIVQKNPLAAIQPLATLLMLMSLFMMAAQVHYLDLDKLKVLGLPIGALLTSTSALVPKAGLIVSLILFFLFNSLQLKWFFRPLAGLWEFYQFAGGIIGNILSYIRLFALGLAGSMLGAAFNYIAFIPVTVDGKVDAGTPLFAVTLLVLLAGHSINIGLAMIGSFVHPLRLTFVEFYGNLGFKGGGKIYSPLKQGNQLYIK